MVVPEAVDCECALAFHAYVSTGLEILYIVVPVGVVFLLIAGIAIWKDQKK
jgi:cytochrome b subunit of formate dehydrogenase